MDGNVYRVLARYYGVDLPINSTKGIKHFKSLAREVMHVNNIRDYNQGIMEFGAIQCAPKKPYCLHCPLNNSCYALKENRVHELPIKLKKTKVKTKYFNYLVVLDKNKNTVLEQRLGKGIWQNLYQFPLVETLEAAELKTIEKEAPLLFKQENVTDIILYNKKPIVHKLSHQHLHTKFWIIHIDSELQSGTVWSEVVNFPVPVLIADFIKTFKI